jgi:hypothetical protein
MNTPEQPEDGTSQAETPDTAPVTEVRKPTQVEMDRIIREMDAARKAAAKTTTPGANNGDPAYMRRTPVAAEVFAPQEALDPVVVQLAEHVKVMHEEATAGFKKGREGGAELGHVAKAMPYADWFSIAKTGGAEGSPAIYNVQLTAHAYRIALTLQMPVGEGECAKIVAMDIGATHLGGDPKELAENLTTEQAAVLLGNWNAMLQLVRDKQTLRPVEEVAGVLEAAGVENGIAYAERMDGRSPILTDAFAEASQALKHTLHGLEQAQRPQAAA